MGGPMKIPTKEERFDINIGKLRIMDVDIIQDLTQETIALLSLVTQCESNVVLDTPVKLRTVAGFDHYFVKGEFSSGDAYGNISFAWTVKTENPEQYDVHKITVEFPNMGECEIIWNSNKTVVDRMSQEYSLFLQASRFVPKRYKEIEALLQKIRTMHLEQDVRDKILPIIDQVSALLGNALKKDERVATYGKE